MHTAMTVRRFCYKLHLWAGLLAGIIVFIVSITGAIYLFKDEIVSMTEPWRKVTVESKPFVHTSRLLDIANKAAHDSHPSAITIGGRGESVWVDYFGENSQATIYLNPYSGKVIHEERKGNGDFDFFNFIINGHLRLWLPQEIGKPLVSYAILLFFITLVTGMVVWWPKRFTRKSIKTRLAFHRPIRTKRLLVDLHNVLGFYMLLPMVAVSLTGLIFGLDWFSNAVYKVASGGKSMEAYTLPASDSTMANRPTASIDLLEAKVKRETPCAVQYYYTLPTDSLGSYRVSVVHEKGSYYKQDNLFFDQHTLEELKGSGPYAGRYKDGSFADKMIRSALDLHEGVILGWFGKLIMLFAALTSASLPITGFMMWRRKAKLKS